MGTISVWAHLGLAVLAMCSGIATGAGMALIGGMGVLSALKKRLEANETDLVALERRLTAEIKARAAVKGVAAREVAKSIEDEARVRLAAESSPTGQQRPSVLNLIRR